MIVPHGGAAQLGTLQVTVCGASSGTATAMNCCVWPAATFAVDGVTLTVTCVTLIVSDPVVVLSAAEVATIVTVFGFGAVAGAV